METEITHDHMMISGKGLKLLAQGPEGFLGGGRILSPFACIVPNSLPTTYTLTWIGPRAVRKERVLWSHLIDQVCASIFLLTYVHTRGRPASPAAFGVGRISIWKRPPNACEYTFVVSLPLPSSKSHTYGSWVARIPIFCTCSSPKRCIITMSFDFIVFACNIRSVELITDPAWVG